MRAGLAVLGAALVLAPAGCGGSGPAAASRSGAAQQAAEHAARQAPRAPLPRARCSPGAANCRAASGRVIYVEAVDPDGDGDAHYVLAGADSVTLPGISVIDVEREMRPRRLPDLGDWVSAAGPVYEGSHGQRQIQATELRYAGG